MNRAITLIQLCEDNSQLLSELVKKGTKVTTGMVFMDPDPEFGLSYIARGPKKDARTDEPSFLVVGVTGDSDWYALSELRFVKGSLRKYNPDTDPDFESYIG